MPREENESGRIPPGMSLPKADDLWKKMLLFIIIVNREIKRVYRNGCRCNERLNAETEGSKTPRTHWVARVNI